MQVSNKERKFIFIVGPKGSGKGTQAERLVRDQGYVHVCIGDLLRQAQQNETANSKIIKEHLEKNELVPWEITAQILQEEIERLNTNKYIIDGFPRNLDQAFWFEKFIGEINIIINFKCDIQTLVSRAPQDVAETVQKKLEVQIENTQELLFYYKKLNKVYDIDATKEVYSVYEKIEQILYPNLIFLYGPPMVGKNTLAQQLANSLHYRYVDLNQFYQDFQCNDVNSKVNKFIKYLQGLNDKNIIVNNFFSNTENIQVFFDHYTKPKHIFHLDASKEIIDQNIKKLLIDQQLRDQKIKEYKQYLEQKTQILDLISKESFYQHIDTSKIKKDYAIVLVAKVLKPKLYLAHQGSNQELCDLYLNQLENLEDKFIKLNVETLVDYEIKINSELGKKIQASTNNFIFKLECIKKTVFKNFQSQKYILVNFSNKLEDYIQLENYVDYLLYFVNDDQKMNENSPEAHYYSQAKLIKINSNNLQLLTQYTNKQPHYSILYDNMNQNQRSNIAKYLQDKYNFKIVDYEKTTQQLKEKLGGEEGALESITFDQLLVQLKQDLDSLNDDQMMFFDGFPYNIQNMQKMIQTLGEPIQLLSIQGTKEFRQKQYRIQAEMDPSAEIGDEDKDKIVKTIKNCLEFSKFFDAYAQQSIITKFQKIPGVESFQNQKLILNKIFQKRIICCNVKNEDDYEKGAQMFLQVCSLLNIKFIDVKESMVNCSQKLQQLIREESNQKSLNPQLVFQIIREQLNKFKNLSKNILIYGYPQANPQDDFFPRVIDEFSQVNECLGNIQALFYITDEFQKSEDFQYNDKVQEREIVEEEKKADNADEEKKDEEGAEKVNTFNPKMFDWSVSDGNCKNSLQVYKKQFPDSIDNQENITSCNQLMLILQDLLEKFETQLNQGNLYQIKLC